MPKLSNEEIKKKVFENSLNTCEYLSGYQNCDSSVLVKCINHNYTFETKWENIRRNNRKHHICPLCQQEDIEKKSVKIECECSYCHKKFMRVPSKILKSNSGLMFCCREHKDLAQRLDAGEEFRAIRPNHYGSGKNYREKAFRFYEHKCACCDWNEDADVLEVHHIDEDRENNDISNLIILCPICHKKLTTHKYELIENKIILK